MKTSRLICQNCGCLMRKHLIRCRGCRSILAPWHILESGTRFTGILVENTIDKSYHTPISKFYCLFGGFKMRCWECDYHKGTRCQKFGIGYEGCQECGMRLSFQYMYLKRKFEKLGDTSPRLCCNCHHVPIEMGSCKFKAI